MTGKGAKAMAAAKSDSTKGREEEVRRPTTTTTE